MMLKKGLYRTLSPGITIEKHGGTQIRHYIYWYLFFELPEKNVGMYGSSSVNRFEPYLKKQIELIGELTKQTDSYLEFYIFNPDTGVNIRFNGQIKGDQLHLKYYHENKPEEIFEDVFEYIGTGETK